MTWLTTKLLGYVSIGLTVLLLATLAGSYIRITGLQRALAQANETNARIHAGIAQERETFERKAREAERKQAEAIAAVADQYAKDMADAQAQADMLVADLRAGNVKLHKRWQAAIATAELSGAVQSAAELDAAARDREESAGRAIAAARAADDQIRGLQGVILAYQEAMK